ncbi:asparagine synthase (glutamine-hydrolyzing) [Haloimpatiens sp. FM7330]
MCGFVTFFSNEKLKEKDKKSIYLMNKSIKHRGPDDEGVYIDDNLIFSFRRLSIIDLEKGKQPFSYENGNYVIVFNGEIYNYIELRKRLKLKGYSFDTESEAEVILTLYKYYGEKFVSQLRGMFAFMIWDKKEQKLIGARDIFGIKPFYYIENDNGLYCASELKSFLQNDDVCTKSIDVQSLHNYFTFQFVPEPKTILKDFSILEPGTMIIKEVGKKLKIKRYHSVKISPIAECKNEKVKKIREVLERSVSMHMRSDVPVATFLSGGIDSTIVAALAKKINPNIKSFTVGFDVNGYSEVELAKQTADKLGIENISKMITPQEFMDELPNIIWHMDEPVADPALVPLYFISKETSKYAKVVLSGEGSDELFGGYNIYHEPYSIKPFSYIPKGLKRILKCAAGAIPEGIKGKSFIERGCTSLEERYFGNAKIFNEIQKEALIKNYNKEYLPTSVTKPFYDNVKYLDDITKMQYIDINTWLRGDILAKADRMTMAHSLELRVPFLDKEVLRVASNLTEEEKINKSTTKYLLREAFKSEIPLEAANRKKLGYPVPIRIWLKNELYNWAVNIVKESETDRYLNKDVVLKMIENHRKGNVDYSRRIWTVLTFMIWHNIFIEKQKDFSSIDKIDSYKTLIS